MLYGAKPPDRFHFENNSIDANFFSIFFSSHNYLAHMSDLHSSANLQCGKYINKSPCSI